MYTKKNKKNKKNQKKKLTIDPVDVYVNRLIIHICMKKKNAGDRKLRTAEST